MTFLRLVAAFCLVLAVALPGVAAAESAPPLPVGPTSYEQCDAWSARFRDYLDALSAGMYACVRRSPISDAINTVPLQCSFGSFGRTCIGEADKFFCTSQEYSAKLAECRSAVKAFLEGRDRNGRSASGDPAGAGGDLRNNIIGGYLDGLPGPMDAVDFAGKDFMTKVGILKQTWDTMANPTPTAILSTGQAFASEIFAGSGASSLASTLFDAASSGVAAGGAAAIGQATDALLAFDSTFATEHPPPELKGIGIPAFHTPAPSSAGGGGGGGSSNSCGGLPGGYVRCTLDNGGWMTACVCRGGQCSFELVGGPFCTGVSDWHYDSSFD